MTLCRRVLFYYMHPYSVAEIIRHHPSFSLFSLFYLALALFCLFLSVCVLCFFFFRFLFSSCLRPPFVSLLCFITRLTMATCAALPAVRPEQHGGEHHQHRTETCFLSLSFRFLSALFVLFCFAHLAFIYSVCLSSRRPTMATRQRMCSATCSMTRTAWRRASDTARRSAYAARRTRSQQPSTRHWSRTTRRR